MARGAEEWAAVEGWLNTRDAARSRRRKKHHLPAECYATSGELYCITLCARHHRDPFTDPSLAAATIEALRYYRNRDVCAVWAYCLMPDHFHGVVSLGDTGSGADEPPTITLMQLVARFKRYTTRASWQFGLQGRLWQRDFYDHIARRSEDWEAQCRYVLENPVRKGLVADWRDYPWGGTMETW